jgi:hypothetical protein
MAAAGASAALGRTVLELVRDVATDLAADGARVKVCVQQALGQGVFQARRKCPSTSSLQHLLLPAAAQGIMTASMHAAWEP